MNRDEHLLVIVGEECAETAQRASKALRFGMDEIQPGQDKNNRERLVEEFNHICASMVMVFGWLPVDEDIIQKKIQQVNKFFEISREQGTLVEGVPDCSDCGVTMKPFGSCFKCPNCGANSGS